MNARSKPPKLAEHLLRWYSERAQIDDLHGDIDELFHEDLKRSGVIQSKLNYWRRVVSLLFSYAIAKRKRDASFHHFSTSQFNPAMFKNYFKTATRNLSKSKFFTAINVFGLALGMSLNLMFVAMIVFTYRFDNFHPDNERIYRVITHVQDRVENPSYASVPIGTAPLLKDFSGIEKVVRVHASLNHYVGYGDTRIPVTGYFADAEYLTMFNFPLLQGNAATALLKPNTMVITEEAALKLFGTKDPMGELAFIEPFGEVMITGVAKNVPKNSHMNFEALVSFATLTTHHGSAFTDDEKNWKNFYNSYCYFLLTGNSNPAAIEEFLNGIAKKQYTTNEFKASFELQRLDKISPGMELGNDIGHGWSYQTMVLMGILPMIILIAACTNYVNLAISQSLKRMKEIGVRKVMGGQKRQIFMQFVMESTIIMLLAVTLSYFLFALIREEALAVTGGDHDWVDLNPTPGTFVGFIVFALLVGLLSGIVPALHFSKITPISALKGKELQTKKGGRFSVRKIVITLQFIFSLGFTMAVVIIVQQYRYSVNYNLGFNKEKILNVELQQADPQLVKNEFDKLSFVPTISMSSHALGAGEVGWLYVRQPEKTDSIETSMMSIDENFISNMGLTLVRGRNFTADVTENPRLIIVNEVFAKKLSPDDEYGALGHVIIMPDKREVIVAGIVKDFHYANLEDPIGNFFFEYSPKNFGYANFHLHTTNVAQAFSEMEAAWKPIGKGDKFKAEFLSDQIKDAYSFYTMIVKIWGFLGLLAITVACLGLLGTVVFTIKNRVKEVSIRKVMGASSESLVYLLSKDFIMLLAIASIITIPTMYLFMEKLLLSAQYYSVPIGASEVLISLSIVLILGMTTILSQTLQAANANPVDNLRVE